MWIKYRLLPLSMMMVIMTRGKRVTCPANAKIIIPATRSVLRKSDVELGSLHAACHSCHCSLGALKAASGETNTQTKDKVRNPTIKE